MKHLFIAVILFFAIVMVNCGQAYAHVESSLFLEHPPKTAFGIFSKTTWLDINGDKAAFALTPFAEFAPTERFSLGLGISQGVFDEEYLFSDMTVAVKGLFKVKDYPVIPMLSLELPTGEEPATSDHTELFFGVFSEKMTPQYHLYGSLGLRTNELDENENGEEKINVFSPHADEELSSSLGLTWWLKKKPMFGIDTRMTAYWEELEESSLEFQSGVVFQKDMGDYKIKFSLSGSFAPDGVREGVGVGFSFYIAR